MFPPNGIPHAQTTPLYVPPLCPLQQCARSISHTHLLLGGVMISGVMKRLCLSGGTETTATRAIHV